MLTRIFGLHGCGKSEYIYEKLENCVKNRQNTFLVVPEQQAVSAERMLIDTLGNPANMYVEVINFKRLCNRVFRESGGVCASYPDKAAEHIAMAHVLYQLSDNLLEYSGLADDAEFALQMLGMVNSMHMNRVSAEALEEVLPELKKRNSDGLYNKANDIVLAYRGYSAYIEQTLEFSGDLLDKLYETLCSFDFFKGKTVFFDSFYGFTAQELAIIDKIIATADDVYISFSCKDENQSDKCFSRGTDAAKACRHLANKNGIKINDVFLTENIKHTSSKALAKIAEEFSLSALAGKHTEKLNDGVKIYECDNVYEEARCAASIVSDLLVSGAKPREIAVCAKDISEYDGIIDSSFESADIPFSFDKHMDLSATPVATLITAAFEVYFSWSLQAVTSFIKTGLSGLTDECADELDIYMHTWNISGKAYFHENWYMNPDGITENEADCKKLERINASKELILECLDGFTMNLDQAETAGDIAKAAYVLLSDIAKLSGKKRFDDGAEGIYTDLLYRVLDSVVETVGKEQMTPRRFYGLFRSIVKNMKSGKIPELIDQVRFSSVSLMRTDGVKYVILLGANDGVFPGAAPAPRILRAPELKALRELGIELCEGDEGSAYDEIFLGYTALCSAKCQAVVTYRKESLSGEVMYPSVIVNILSSLLGTEVESFGTASVLDSAVSNELLFDKYLTMPEGTEKATVREYFMQKDDYKDRILSSERWDSSYYGLSDENLKRIYGQDMLSSYSRLEKFKSCPFSYFCRYTLRLSPAPKAELGALEMGNTVHKVLEELIPVLTKASADGIKDEAVEQLVKQKLEEMLERLMPGRGTASTKRFEYLLARLEGRISALCKELLTELKVSRFIPVDFELNISPGGDVKPAVIPLSDGRTLSIVGQIDRVDLYKDEKTGLSWVRITDYKTGSKEFKMSDIKQGFNLQMLLYLYTLTVNESSKYGKLYPAGVMYRIVKQPKGSAELFEASADDFSEPDTTSELSGLVVDDPEILFAMDTTGTDRFIPVKLKRKSEYAMPLDELTGLLEESVQLAGQLADEMSSGDKKAVPCTENDRAPCSYCEYAAMCPGYVSGGKRY